MDPRPDADASVDIDLDAIERDLAEVEAELHAVDDDPPAQQPER